MEQLALRLLLDCLGRSELKPRLPLGHSGQERLQTPKVAPRALSWPDKGYHMIYSIWYIVYCIWYRVYAIEYMVYIIF